MAELASRLSRRALIASGGATAAMGMVGAVHIARPPMDRPQGNPSNVGGDQANRPLATLDPKLLRRALGALDRHAGKIASRDRIAIADFTVPSSQPRFHLLDLGTGKSIRYLVAHGSGSDPEHTGVLHSFSNQIDSNASSEGAFFTANYYVGKHGRSQRLLGLDETNCNALTRSIVVHGAWYANADMIPAHGKLGRSQGCFAVGEEELAEVFDFLGEGRLIYAAKV